MRMAVKLIRPQARDNDSKIDSTELKREKYGLEQGLKGLAI
jgi:hypothetical protein